MRRFQLSVGMSAWSRIASLLLVIVGVSEAHGDDLIGRWRAVLPHVTESANPDELRTQCDHFFSGISRTETAQLSFYPDPKVALNAAWRTFRGNVHVVVPFPGDESEPVAFRSLACSRWIGFIEGRLNEPLPEAWVRTLQEGTVDADGGELYLTVQKSFGLIHDKFGARSPNVEFFERDSTIEIWSGDQMVAVSKTSLPLGAVDTLAVGISPDEISVVCVSRGSSTEVLAYSQDSPTPIWRREFHFLPYGGIGGKVDDAHIVRLSGSGESVTVFSANTMAMSVQRWKLKDGKYEFGFTTAINAK